MISTYLRITFRTMLKHKGFSSINIFGLALSISICLMIIIFIKDQKSSDRFHEKRDRIVRVYTTDKEIVYSEVRGFATTPGSLASYLLNNYPFIEDAVRLRHNGGSVIHEGAAILVGGMYAEPSFFNIFSYQLKAGNPQTALDEPYSIVISEETAFKFFGNDDPINKTLTFEKLGDFTVTGVLRDLEKKSHFRFDALFSFATVLSLENSGAFDTDVNDWSSFESYYTYVLLKNKADQSLLKEHCTEIADVIFPEPENERYGFKVQPLLKINLGINLWRSMPGTVKSFELIFIPFLAILIMFIACFNYVILSISHSLKRTREIGLHKVIGASRSQIIKLFLCETFAITTFALISACLLILWLIPAFNGLDLIENSKLQINIQQMKDPGLYLIFILFATGVSILAGLFPALYLSSFQPVNALKGVSRIKGISHLLTRKILMGIQFAVSLIFIIFIIYSQHLYTYLTTLNYGIETENLVNIYLQDVNHEIFRNEINSNSNITDVSLSNEVPIYGSQRALDIRNDDMEKPRSTFYYSVDPGFINNFNIELLAGRNFSPEFSTDMENAIIVNQEALRVFDLGSPVESIGKTLIAGDGLEVMVIGVVKNFIYYYPDEPITALVLRYRPQEFRFVNIRYAPGTKDEIRAYLQDTWKKFDEVHGVRYEFFDDAKQQSDSEIGGIIGIFSWAAGFVILIALLGLLGMAIYSTEMRIKEIGIRKVLGASVSNLAYLLSKDYIKLILYSAAFAIPAAYFLSSMFYQFFAFRPGLSLWVLPAALIFILMLALITISSQTVKAATANPTETLREE
ncbi:MAG: ABC transporter permease [Fidelibacterota bacterium]|nr:MAG: ABC transporter permease [Candidatus Neomarinimicrobiota bacterium]